jgi:segregation and condensation protein B
MDDLKAIVEALVFVSESPVKTEQIAEALDLDKTEVGAVLLELCREYAENDRGFELQRVSGGYQFRTRARHADWVRRLSRAKPFRFSRAALETLAIIAYRQPVTRADIEYLRGVDSGGVLKTLLDKRLVRILGKKDIPGRPMIYGTSRDFLELFGLNDLSGLPTLREFDQLSLDLPLLEGTADGSKAP